MIRTEIKACQRSAATSAAWDGAIAAAFRGPRCEGSARRRHRNLLSGGHSLGASRCRRRHTLQICAPRERERKRTLPHCARFRMRLREITQTAHTLRASMASLLPLVVSLVLLAPAEPCGKTLTRSGRLTSPGYPMSYPPNVRCSYTLRPQGPGVCAIELKFDELDVDGHMPRCDAGDAVQLSSTGERFCGVEPPPPIDSACGGTFSKERFRLEGPPSAGGACLYQLRKFDEAVCQVQVRFQRFSVGDGGECNKGRLLIAGRSLCGSRGPDSVARHSQKNRFNTPPYRIKYQHWECAPTELTLAVGSHNNLSEQLEAESLTQLKWLRPMSSGKAPVIGCLGYTQHYEFL
ncbi:hypothetical protein HPB50_025647 [Hyalomma asiaticum]|uniref:Uncharacterized protein n=1 Tax=Hyalomma asiaticum TaxID=266040 RepID=A0ACB7TT96_HYAAI|nr:hypothetical protein HPB50_025647 [Hyalomma asiaticum]